MKRILLILILPLLLLCAGCQDSIYANYRDVEHLRPVQMLGFDADPDSGAVIVSVSAGEGRPEKSPAVLSQAGGSIETALVQLQNAFPEAQPYYAHVQFVLFGRAAAEQGMRPWLEWIERNPKMRLDPAAFVVRDSAAELILSSAAENGGTTQKMTSLNSELHTLGEGYAFLIRSLAATLADNGSGLCGAIRCADKSGAIRFDDSASILPAGFAVFRDERLCTFIEEEDAPAVLLLLSRPEGARVELDAGDDGRVTVALGAGHTKIDLDGAAARVDCSVEASLLETDGGAPDMETVTALLSERLTRQTEGILALEHSLGCDFLGLTDGRDPAALDFSVSVTVQPERSYGLRQREEGA